MTLENFTLPPFRSEDVLVRPIYGSWEANIDHALRRSPVDVCELRGEDRVVLGNAGVVRVERTGRDVTTVRPGDLGIVFCNGQPDDYGYPVSIFGYDAPGSVGVLAKRTVLHQRQIIPVPPQTRLSLTQWAGFSLRYVTAWANWRVAWGSFRVQMPEVDPADVHVWAWGGGVGLAELELAKAAGCQTAMLTSQPSRIEHLKSVGITPIDRSSFREDHFQQDFLDAVMGHTGGRGVSIFIDNLGVQSGATMKALGRQGVITTSGWKHRTVYPVLRPVACQNRHIYVFTHYARYVDGLDAVRFAERTGWAPAVSERVYPWEDVPQLAKDYAAGQLHDYCPVFQVNSRGE
jgi:NADPH:quinone reductase-like Zn-dependent oxidoreductase